MQLEQIREEVKHILSEKRYKHSLGVEKRAAELGAIYGVDIEKAKLAGITHDIAKEMTKEEMKEAVRRKMEARQNGQFPFEQ